MIEEPFRFVEAIANRREYIETQIATGSPIVALNYAGGILVFTLGRERQKVFEIYDRIAMGAIGHPGDIERLRMTAIELASTEGFTRSASDVSLRRMANYSISPALKAAFEQIYGAPYLARVLFAELGPDGAQNTFLRVDYDGSIQSNGTPFSKSRQEYAVLGGARASAEQMEKFLARDYKAGLDLTAARRGRCGGDRSRAWRRRQRRGLAGRGGKRPQPRRGPAGGAKPHRTGDQDAAHPRG